MWDSAPPPLPGPRPGQCRWRWPDALWLSLPRPPTPSLPGFSRAWLVGELWAGESAPCSPSPFLPPALQVRDR